MSRPRQDPELRDPHQAKRRSNVSINHYERRADIDGLRAVAAISILIFHFFPAVLTGGYIGVDVFFVISGYVISLLILKDLQQNQFRIIDFYSARAKRLLPSLLIVTTFCLAAGWALLLQNEFLDLGRRVVETAFYIQNFGFYYGLGYFDTSKIPSPLLHYWSLALEEQFYIIWPLVLVYLSSARRHNYGAYLIIAVASISFFVNILLIDILPQFTFYMLPSRAWEFLFGAFLAWRYATSFPGDKRAHQLRSIVGGVAIVASWEILNETSSFPGWWALLPVLGTSLIISAPSANINRIILSSAVLVWIGRRSYPLYLWHWPILVFAQLVYLDELPIWARALLFLVSFLTAHLTYLYLEVPIHQRPVNQIRKEASRLVVCSGVIACAGAAIAVGFVTERLSVYRAFSMAENDWEQVDNLVILPGRTNERVLFFGDSYVAQYFPRAAALARDQIYERTIVFFTQGGCAPIPNINRRSIRSCQSFAQKGFSIASDPQVQTVVIGGSWLGLTSRGDYFESNSGRLLDLKGKDLSDVLQFLRREISALVSSGKEVYLVLNPPGGRKADPVWLARSTGKVQLVSISMQEHLERVGSVNQIIADVGRQSGAIILDPADWFCAHGKCMVFDAGGRPIYRDQTHLRASYVRASFSFFDKIFSKQRPAL